MLKVGGIIKKVFPRASVISIKRLRKGCVNEIYEIKIKNPDKKLILRLFPDDGWKAVKEGYIYSLISKKTKVPVPEVYLIDSSKKILPNSFTLSPKIKGRELSKKNKKMIEKAGENLAKIHKIKFKKFGWIVGKKINPSFSKWSDFCKYDLEHKLENLEKHKHMIDISLKSIRDYFNKNKKLLDIKSKPCLIHKDYHSSHILVDGKEITGIIDVEWAISGHNELDIAKSLLWMFDKNKGLERFFLKGYKKYGSISKEFPKRRKLYEVLIMVSSSLFSCELDDTKWFKYNMKKLKEIIR